MRPFKVRIGDDPNRSPEEKEKGYTGWAEILVPNEGERLKRSVELSRAGNDLQDGELNDANIASTVKILEMAKNSVKDISVSFGDGDPVTSVEDLSYLAEWHAIALEIVSVVTNGPKSKAILKP